MPKQLDIVLHSDCSPETCLAKLSAEIDIDRWILFSFSGYRGTRSIVGFILGNEFRLHKRRYWRNSFGPVLFGRVLPYGQGSSIEAYWDIWQGTRLFMRAWLGLVIMFGAPILVIALRDLIRDRSLPCGDNWLAVVVPLALIVWGLVLPRIGVALSFHERKHVVQLLERVLVAGPEAGPSAVRSWKSSLNSWRMA